MEWDSERIIFNPSGIIFVSGKVQSSPNLGKEREGKKEKESQGKKGRKGKEGRKKEK